MAMRSCCPPLLQPVFYVMVFAPAHIAALAHPRACGAQPLQANAAKQKHTPKKTA